MEMSATLTTRTRWPITAFFGSRVGIHGVRVQTRSSAARTFLDIRRGTQEGRSQSEAEIAKLYHDHKSKPFHG
jgi:hypothetical protein